MKTEDENIIDFDDVESKDLEEESFDLKEPFDPKEIDIQVQQTTMSTLIDRLEHNEIDLNPDFQRSADLWRPEIKSRLVESLLIRFPIPAFYFDATDEDKWQVVDGLQRLTTIKKFVIDKTLKLKGLEFLKELEHKCYKDLNRTLIRRIDQSPVTLYLIKPGTPVNVKYSLFYRINTGGLTLNPQEIRHALSQSVNKAQASNFLKELSNLSIFKTCVRVSDKRMLDKELILRYIAFRTQNIEDYKAPMIRFLNDTMERLGGFDRSELDLLKSSFEKSVKLSWDIFADDAFRKSILEKDSKRKVVNRALFEAVSVVFSDLSNDQINVLKARKDSFLESYIHLIKEDTFDESISIATTNVKSIKYRFEKIRELVNNYINSGEKDDN